MTTTRPRVLGIHVNWTAPHFLGRRHDGFVAAAKPTRYDVHDFELLTTALSVLSWRRFHGPMRLYTDGAGERFAAEVGIAELYDSIDTSVLTSPDAKRISPAIFWAGGKLLAYRAAPLPFACIDTDLFLYRPIANLLGHDVMVAHHETLSPFIYPSRAELPNPMRVRFPRWDWSTYAGNCSIAVLNHAAHRTSYTDLAIRYMLDNDHVNPRVFPYAQQVFAEQRVIGFEAKRLGLRYGSVLPVIWEAQQRRWVGRAPAEHQLHHTWRTKNRLIEDDSLADMYCLALAGTLMRDHAAELGVLGRIPRIARWLQQVSRVNPVCFATSREPPHTDRDDRRGVRRRHDPRDRSGARARRPRHRQRAAAR